MNIEQYWNDVLRQDAEAIRTYFHPNAWVNWHNTNEHFTVEEFIRANCEYPGYWSGKIEQIIEAGDHIVTAVHVYTQDHEQYFHVTSFIHLRDKRIISIDEYWGDDGPAPQWRLDMKIGQPIK